MPYCQEVTCGDQFHANESSDGRFCSWECREADEARMDQNEEDYDMGYGPDVRPRLSETLQRAFDEATRFN